MTPRPWVEHDGAMETDAHLVFVYGTLRRSFQNHHLLTKALFLSSGWTRKRYALYLDDYPYCVQTEHVSRVRGELYKVEYPTLMVLDALEEHPRVYRREKVAVDLDDGREMQAWVYFYPRPRGRLLLSGDLAEGA